MKKQILTALINVVIGMMKPEILKAFADKVLDFIEDFAANSNNKYDDILILPLCEKVRDVFDIPDDD